MSGGLTLRMTRISVQLAKRLFPLPNECGSSINLLMSGVIILVSTPPSCMPSFPAPPFFTLRTSKTLPSRLFQANPKAFVLDRAILVDRSAAFRGEWTAPTARTVASAMHVGTTSSWWWEPVRRAALRYAGVPESVIARNLEGLGAVDPAQLNNYEIDITEPVAPQETYKDVVTYISRQNSRRRLTQESHDELVAALEDRAAKLGWELVIVEAEKMSKEEQLALAGRTTVSTLAEKCRL